MSSEQNVQWFDIRGDFITLDRLLKATSIASSGGEAKMMIARGDVLVDGQIETRKTCKIRPGQRVEASGWLVHLRAEVSGTSA